MNKIFTQLLEKRGIGEEFLNPVYERLEDSFLLPDMEKAAEHIIKARNEQAKILIYGDYDVDGVTASAVMEQALRESGLSDIEIMLPDRFVDGYGMSERLVKRAVETKRDLVITVDCGSRNFDIVKKLNEQKIGTIITDHHECEEKLPEAVAVINPKRQDYTGPATLKELAGVGVAFKVAEALVKKGLIRAGQEKWLLDLVLIGTICDSMLLTHENRTLCYYGLKVLAKTRRPGLIELLKKAGVRNLTSEAIGFQIGPRLNAAGRLESAEIALELLRTRSQLDAVALAEKLETLNQKRRTEEQAALKEIRERRRADGPVAAGEHEVADEPITVRERSWADGPVIVETGSWHEGILGIVAGRLVEQYHRPAFVLSEVEPGILKGSGRSFGDFNLAAALQNSSQILSGGGHAAAAGVKLAKSAFDGFKTELNDYYRSLNLKNQERFLKVIPDLNVQSLEDFSLELVEDLKKLEPFGNGNEEPIFQLEKAGIADLKRMGAEQNHLRLYMKADDGKIMKTVAFFAPEKWFHLEREIRHNFLFKVAENEWQGMRSIEGRLVDII